LRDSLKRGVGRMLGVTIVVAILVFYIQGSNPILAAVSVSPHSSKKAVASGHPSPPFFRQIPASPPPMGWSTWNSFADVMDSALIMQQTKALIASGMQKAGYRYINIDGGWWRGDRDEDGNIIVDSKHWPALTAGERPGDMSNIVRYIHSFGLKAGIYTDVGKTGCGTYGSAIGAPRRYKGSEGHYDQDFLQFAKWGFDYVKVDWCGGNKENLDPAVQYAAIAHSIERAERITGHPLFFSICEWGNNSPWTWAPGIGGVAGDIWRTSGDILPAITVKSPYSMRMEIPSFSEVLSNFDQSIHPQAQHTGFYNDPDMMVLGIQGLSDAQNRVHMSLWAISGAPLIAGADLTRLSSTTTAILTNPEVIAVDQDSLGLQSILVAQPSPGLQVWAKPLAHAGEHAVVLFNRTAASAQISVGWSEVGLEPSSPAMVRNLWARKDLGTYRSSYSATVQPGDAIMLTLRGIDEKATRYEAGSSANECSGGVKTVPYKNCPGKRSVATGGERALTFEIAPMQGPTYIQISYINRSKSTRTAQLRVNGQIATNINFPPTGGSGGVGTITIEADLDQTRNKNLLTFFSPHASGPVLESISVLGGRAELYQPQKNGPQ
jgi:hypothetical protein